MSKYDARKEVFIQNYAKANNLSVHEARAFYRDKYIPSSNSKRRKIARQTSNKIKDQYLNKHPADDGEGKTFKRPKINKQQKGRLIKKGQKKLSFGKVKTTRKTKTWNRVEKGFKKYPNATKYELQHGINSKASQEYRIKHGRNSDFK